MSNDVAIGDVWARRFHWLAVDFSVGDISHRYVDYK